MMNDVDVDVVIVGGGPVGLYLGCLLAVRGRSFVVLEKRTEPIDHSRSIGIHPPLLESMQRISLAERLIDEGVRIQRGRGYWNSRAIGTMDFARLPGPYRFVLSLPQTRTESHVRTRLEELAPGSRLSGVAVESLEQEGGRVHVRAVSGLGTWTARMVVGCDGKRGVVRTEGGFDFPGGPYPDRYLMGDFAESTGLGSDAALCLGRSGLVESFPLPSGERRWVVRLAGSDAESAPESASEMAHSIAGIVRRRTPFRVDPETASMTSAFGVERFEAVPMAKDRIFLAGDAAHVISPIGGQGMNLGWFDANAVAECAAAAVDGVNGSGTRLPAAAARYAAKRSR
ncbi:MAG: FAD-dependent monooxygenase, partial [Rhodothermales bacterium]|nr:FAD-dependent monooxygenase [Rhodothermales bacterium]